ncbi:MAG: sulfite dehydrogenase [Gammaproteobacteria bacterium]|nr:sulfite dehydrogenase [Gammaproteobacteria bacterium]
MRSSRAVPEYDDETRRLIDAMREAEERAIAARFEASLDYSGAPAESGQRGVATRRQFLFGAAALAGTGSMLPRLASAAPPGAMDFPVPADSTREQGRLTNDDGGYGSRSQFEDEVRWRFPTATKESSWTMTPLADGMGVITPSGLHFERHHGGIPNINPASHSLTIHGMVNSAMQFTMDDIKRFPSVSRIHFIECSGNGLTEWREPTLKTVQGTHGLTSTSEWTGVPLSTLLREVGVKPRAAWILAEGADAAVMTRSIPLEKGWSDAIVAYGQNGEALRPEQGHPLRLVLPGFEGNTHIKWLRRLEISDQPFMTREETSKYTDLLDGGKARQFSFTMEAKSVITFPSGEMKLPGAGFYEVTGLAWSGRGRVKRVEVSADGGKNWHLASLQDPILPVCHTRFRFPWFWDGQPAVLQSRCQDETGYIQPTIKQLVDVRGLGGGKYGSIYHLNGIQSWNVAADGSVSNVHHYA